VYKPTDSAVASRKLSETVLTALTPQLPELIGGSADLTGSNLTKVPKSVDFQPPSTGLGDYKGIYIRYGVREHAMGAIMNGLAAYGGIIPFGGTFLVCPPRPFGHTSESLTTIAELCLLRCRRRPSLCSERSPSHLGRNARLDRSRRGRTDPPARRNCHSSPRCAKPAFLAPS